MTLENVIELLTSEYERAKNLEYVIKPLSYALYQVWKIADKREQKRLSKMAQCPFCGDVLGKRNFQHKEPTDNKEYYCHNCERYFDKNLREVILEKGGAGR